MRKIVLEAPYKMSITECEAPTPAPGEVRIEVKRIGICGSDPTIYRGLHPYVSSSGRYTIMLLFLTSLKHGFP